MKPRFHVWPVIGLVVFVGVTTLLYFRNSSAVYYSGYGRAETGAVQLDLAINPPIGKPGDILTLTMRVANRTMQPQTPSIAIILPTSLSADIYDLPAGATFSVPDNRIDWLPSISAAGETAFVLDVQVQTTDVIHPEQTVTAHLRHQGSEAEASALIWLGIPPLISDLSTDAQVAVGQPIGLHAGIVGPGPIQITWDLGDGRRLQLAEPVVVFPATGRYEIEVTATNPVGTVTRRVNLDILPNPVASFQPDDDTPVIGQSVGFISYSGGQPPLTVFWDFGDGNTITGEQQPAHIYRQSGTYTVRLVVENAFGRSEAFWPINVGGPPVADLLIPDNAVVGQPIEGQAFGDESVVRYAWEMGDGRVHEGEELRHVYRLPGDYFVTLIAENDHGETRVGRWVRVEPGTTSLYLPLAANQASNQAVDTYSSPVTDIPLEPVVVTLGEQFSLDPIPFPDGTSPVEKLLAYLNVVRQQFELAPLTYSYELSLAAQSHTLDKASFPDNPHTGSDGTSAAERLLRAGYRGGYAGEATAWGYADPHQAVEFWVNSDTHRPILLNRLATDVGLGYIEDYGSSNVWHWTAEFAVNYGAPVQAVIRQQTPAAAYSTLSNEVTNYSWMWPLPLAAGERFTVYLVAGNRTFPIGTVAAPVYGSRYILSVDAASLATTSAPSGANYQWFVRLENNQGATITESERRSITILIDPGSPTPEPTIAIITATPAGPTATPTVTPIPVVTSPEPPPVDQPPVVITSTPPATPSP
jgi:uncharacterized protein YkwD